MRSQVSKSFIQRNLANLGVSLLFSSLQKHRVKIPYMAEPSSSNFSSATAVLLGALASGVNGPTWFALKIAFLMLGVTLSAMLALAFSSSDFVIVGHVALLVIISALLFILLNGFLAQTGLVTVKQQMEEMGILQMDSTDKDKKNT
ncbi:hypothetical protein J5N97_022129 [Dioscorea zingiberensis]|uniref:Transmembrane protein n=1 Tax=Dioscorea zingiberensis TaxID=325984 RepID=A0A9D5CAW6_9LILI|nr:hypothetical protein J5N97_022129 [Dioscorea zingiberensis]